MNKFGTIYNSQAGEINFIVHQEFIYITGKTYIKLNVKFKNYDGF